MKKPAYGKQLLERRQAGDHPARVAIVYGDDWRWASRIPRLAIKPEDFGLGAFDFRVVAGVPVEIVDRCGDLREIDGCPALFWLAAEVAAWACEVRVSSVAWEDDAAGEIVSIAFGCKRGPVWPDWWPEKLNEDYGRRNEQYWAEKRAHLAAVCGGVRQGVPLGRSQ